MRTMETAIAKEHPWQHTIFLQSLFTGAIATQLQFKLLLPFSHSVE